MAEKKSSSSSKSSKPTSKAKATSAAKAEAPKTAKKPAKAHAAKSAPSTAPAAPLIDTGLAAHNAARMLAAGVSGKSVTPPAKTPLRPESSMFKQLKSGLNKPSTATSNLLDKTHGPSPHKAPNAYNKQVGHNQTSGADPTRSGVPRRTNG